MGFKFKTEDQKLHEQAKYAPAKRHTAKWQWYLLVLIIISPIIYFTYKFVVETFIPKAEGYITFNKIVIRAPAKAYVGKIFVEQGTSVKKSQSLVKLEIIENKEELEYLEKEVKYLQGKVESTMNPELYHLLEMKKEAQDYVKELTLNYKQLEKLRKKTLVSFNELQQSRIDLNEARMQVYEVNKKISQSNYNHELAMEYYFKDKMRKRRSELEKLQKTSINSNILSPLSGTVVSLQVHEKEYVTVNKELMEIATDSNMHVKAYLPSRFFTRGIHEGTKVTIVFPNNTEAKGVIYKIQRLAEMHPNISSVIKQEKNRVVLLIRLTGEIPEKFQIYGLPVEIKFSLF